MGNKPYCSMWLGHSHPYWQSSRSGRKPGQECSQPRAWGVKSKGWVDGSCARQRPPPRLPLRRPLPTSQDHSQVDSHFTRLKREVRARRQVGWEETALGYLRTWLKTTAGRQGGDFVRLFLARRLLPLGQHCHGLLRKEYSWPLSVPSRKGEKRQRKTW